MCIKAICSRIIGIFDMGITFFIFPFLFQDDFPNLLKIMLNYTFFKKIF